jgi:phenylacetate-coenzyme A ligase PaaK-like adenylate-forming protein
MPRSFFHSTSLDTAFDQWTVGALVTNLLWTRCLGRASIAAARDQRLRERITHARTHSHFYRKHYRELPHDAPLDALPPVTKVELMASFDEWPTDRAITWRKVEEFVSSRLHIGERFLDRYLAWTSSGTTGSPGVFLQDAAALAIYDALVAVQLVGALPHWSAASRHGRAALITADSDHFAAITAWRRQAQRRPWLDMKTIGVTLPLPEIVDALEQHDPAFVASYPTVLTLLAEEQNAGRLELQLAGVWSGGEALSPTARALVEDAFDCPFTTSTARPNACRSDMRAASAPCTSTPITSWSSPSSTTGVPRRRRVVAYGAAHQSRQCRATDHPL